MSVLYLLTAALIVACPWLTAQRYGMLPWVSPLHFVSYFAFFGVFVKTVTFILVPEIMLFNSFIENPGSILGGYIFVLGFICFISFGYVIGIRRRKTPELAPLAKNAVSRIRSPRILAAMGIGVFLLAALSLLSARGLGGVTMLFSVETIYALNTTKVVATETGVGQSFAALKGFFVVSTLAMLVWIARQMRQAHVQNIIMIVVLGATVVFSILVEAKRLELLNLIFYYLCISVFMGSQIGGRYIIRVFFVFFAVLGIFSLMTALRATKGGLDNFEVALLGPLLQISSSTYFIDINVPVVIVDQLDRLHLFLGESYFYWAIGWIPRDFWPEKPVITLGPYVKQVVMGLHGSLGGINPTGAGEALLNFGWAGIAFGAFLGWLCRRIEEYLLRPDIFSIRGGFWIYPLVFLPFLTGLVQSSFSATVVGAAFNLVLLKVVLSLVSLRWRLLPDKTPRLTSSSDIA